MTATTANNRKFMASAALVVLVAAGAYGLGRVYPPLGPSEASRPDSTADRFTGFPGEPRIFSRSRDTRPPGAPGRSRTR